MIDVQSEHIITLAEATKFLPNRPSVVTLWRWRSRGIAGIRLETVCVGGRTFTSLEAMARFVERVTAAKAGQSSPTGTNRQRKAQQLAARRALQEAGLLE